VGLGEAAAVAAAAPPGDGDADLDPALEVGLEDVKDLASESRSSGSKMS